MTTAFDDYKALRFDTPAAGVLRITLSDPEKFNAVNETMHTELARVWRDIDNDSTIKVALITGEGANFSAGGSFDLVERIADDFAVRARLLTEARDLVYNIVNCSKPVVSAMRGAAVGAGLVAGLLADISIASRTARIIDGHTRLGVAAGDHAAIIWPLLCGMAKAKYHLLLCEPVNGEEAERMGLVSRVVDDDALDDTALDIAKRLAAGAPTAISWTKYALNNWLRQAGPGFDASLALEFLGFTGPELREGLASLREKRAADFHTKSAESQSAERASEERDPGPQRTR